MWLPLSRPLLGTWPATQVCALTGNPTATLWFTACAQSTEPHQPGAHFLDGGVGSTDILNFV